MWEKITLSVVTVKAPQACGNAASFGCPPLAEKLS